MPSLSGIGTAALLSSVTLGIHAGDLDPPGAPTPTPGPEPRIAISAETTPGDADSVFRITGGGSYFLADNVIGEPGKSGIEIVAAGVTLDLMGFEMTGVTGSLDGIVTLNAGRAIRRRVTVRNGTVARWGGSGVNLESAEGTALADLMAFDNGGCGLIGGALGTVTACVASGNQDHGIAVGQGSVVTECAAGDNGAFGYASSSDCTFTHCTASENEGHGFFLGSGAAATGCVSAGNGQDGFFLFGNSVVRECVARDNGQDGFDLQTVSIVEDCVARGNTANGIRVFARCIVRGNSCSSNGDGGGSGAGIVATQIGNRIEGNSVGFNDRGIEVTGSDNLIVRNTATSLGQDSYGTVDAGNNELGTVQTTVIGSGPWDNFDF